MIVNIPETFYWSTDYDHANNETTMCEFLDYEVTALKRTRIINVPLDVQEGKYRHLTEEELTELNRLIEPSSSTEEASLPSNKAKFTGKRNYGERNR